MTRPARKLSDSRLSLVILSLLSICWAGAFAPGSVLAQPREAEALRPLNLLDDLQGLGLPAQGLQGLGLQGLGSFESGEADAPVVTFSAQFQLTEGSRDGRLMVRAEIAPHWHIYSLTQPPGGPMRSRLTVRESSQFEILADFQPDRPPQILRPPHKGDNSVFDVPIEQHAGHVIWAAPIRLAESTNPAELVILVDYQGQACEKSCIPLNKRGIEARLPLIGSYRAENSYVTIHGQISPAQARPGDTVRLTLTAEPDDAWYVYALAPTDPNLNSKPTLIALNDAGGFAASEPKADRPPREKASGLDDEPVTYYDEQPISWHIDLQIPSTATVGTHEISGLMGYQTCTENRCDMPHAARFAATVEVAAESVAEPAAVRFAKADYGSAAQLAASVAAGSASLGLAATGFDQSKLVLQDDTQDYPLYMAILIALGGGFILNFMPCVLPVIGLKVMSFVEQAGKSRARAFALNAWYSLGLLSVFMVLATLTVVSSFGWGEQNQSFGFNVTMAAIVFVMALSFLGVWEIPIPGFIGSGKAAELTAKEGVSGAISKGVVTTILAVPCSGPLLATALAWCHGKPAALVYLVFFFLALGMAAPYLLIGAYPRLIRFLPRPGAWMDTFKQLLGFVMLGTVIWIFTYIRWEYMLPTLTFLFGLWAACWWIGRIPVTADLSGKLRGWVSASAFATLVALFAFGWLGPVMETRFIAAVERHLVEQQLDASRVAHKPENPHELPWQPYSLERLTELTTQGKTVMVDFTADWCPTCKVLEANVLNTQAVRSAVAENLIVPLLADWTNPNPEISQMLELLGGKQIPVLAIFPADRPNRPIILRGGYTQQSLIEKLVAAATPGDAAELKTAATGY